MDNTEIVKMYSPPKGYNPVLHSRDKSIEWTKEMRDFVRMNRKIHGLRSTYNELTKKYGLELSYRGFLDKSDWIK